MILKGTPIWGPSNSKRESALFFGVMEQALSVQKERNCSQECAWKDLPVLEAKAVRTPFVSTRPPPLPVPLSRGEGED